MKPNRQHLLDLLTNNPSVILAYYDNPAHPNALTIVRTPAATNSPLALPAALDNLHVRTINRPDLRPLIAPANYSADPTSRYQACQNPPIRLGCQIQPAGANWVGTAGSPAKWAENGRTCYGLLTNWHVIASGDETVGRRVHQPDTGRPPIAFLTRWLEIDPNEINYCDCAVADCEISGQHSISPEILDLGELSYPPAEAFVGDPATKIGRTTGRTTGKCTATGATARINYGDFTALFADQDVYADERPDFSAPGDSGSLIVDSQTKQPLSLLFAGNGDMTIANPMRHVAKALELLYPFP